MTYRQLGGKLERISPPEPTREENEAWGISGAAMLGSKPNLNPLRNRRGARASLRAAREQEWWALQDSNLRPRACEARALTN